MKFVAAVFLPLLLLLTGCSPYVAGYYYHPHPGLSAIPATQPTQPPVVSAFASIVGIRKPDSQLNLPWSVEVRLRVDNNSPDPITFDPRSMQLTTGDLVRFPPPILPGAGVQTIPPGESALVTADFPFPAGQSYDQVDLSSLELRWIVSLDGHNVMQAMNFHREITDAYYYDDGPYWGYGPYWDAGFYPVGYPYPVYRGAVIIRR